MDIAYTILKQLVLPPGSLLIILALAFMLVRGTLGRLLLFIGWSALLAMSLPALAMPMIAALEQHPAIVPTAVADTGAEAIVVLGGDIYSDAPEYGAHTLGPRSLERVRYTAWLHRQTGLPIYIAGGEGRHAPGPPMQRVLIEEFGVPVTRMEEDSRTTWENAEVITPLLRADGIHHVLLVTNAWHMARAVTVFEREGLRVTPAPTYFIHRAPGDYGGKPRRGRLSDWLPQATAFANSSYAVHEWLGQVYYDLRARLARPDPLPHPAPPEAVTTTG